MVLTDNILLVTSDEGFLIAVDPTGGSMNWQAEVENMLRTEYDYNISFAVLYEGLTYNGKENGSLVGVDLFSDELAWQVDFISPAQSQPLFIGDTICNGSMTELSCIDIKTKNILWRQSLDWPNSPVSDGDIIVVGSRWGYGVFAFDLNTREQRWKYSIVDWAPSELVIQVGITYIGKSDNNAFFYR